MPRPSTVALDGPVAAGKTTVGRLLAQRLGYRFLDTGAMYRAVTWAALARGIDPQDEASLSRLAQSLAIEVVAADDGVERVLVQGRDAAQELRRPEVEQAVSLVARVAGVRQALVSKQRALAQEGSIVMVGRDIGTVVLPHADLKVFLLASVQERARRRHQELQTLGQKVKFRSVLRDLERRDLLDSQRSVAPLRPAPDARQLDTDGLTPEQVVERILALMDA